MQTCTQALLNSVAYFWVDFFRNTVRNFLSCSSPLCEHNLFFYYLSCFFNPTQIYYHLFYFHVSTDGRCRICVIWSLRVTITHSSELILTHNANIMHVLIHLELPSEHTSIHVCLLLIRNVTVSTRWQFKDMSTNKTVLLMCISNLFSYLK